MSEVLVNGASEGEHMAESNDSAGVLYQALMRHFLHQDRMVYMSLPTFAVIQTAIMGGSWSVGGKGHPWLGAFLAALGVVLSLVYVYYLRAALADRNVNRDIMDKLAQELMKHTSAKDLPPVRMSSEKGRLRELPVFWLFVFVVMMFIMIDLLLAGWLARG